MRTTPGASSLPLVALLCAGLLAPSCGPPAPRADPEPRPRTGSEAAEGAAGELVDGPAADAHAAAFAEGAAALRREEYPWAAQNFEKAIAVNPGDEVAHYLAAAAWARHGDAEAVARHLRRLAELGSDLRPREGSFAAVAGDPVYRAAANELSARGREVVRSEVAFFVEERDFYPEGMAWDPVEEAFYLGSMHHGKVVRARREAGGWRLDELVPPGVEGVYAVVGMEVDPERRLLWAATASFELWRGFAPETGGKASLVAFRLGDGSVAELHPVDLGEPPRGVNDVAVAADGTVYATDTFQGCLYRVPPGGELEIFRPAGSFPGANGLALSADESKLYVSEWPRGLVVVDLASGRTGRLPHPRGVSLHAADGLYHREGSLVGVMNAAGRGRIVRFRLDEAGTAITGAEILEAGHPLVDGPTTGALTEDAFYYIADAQLRALTPEGRALPPEELDPTPVLRLPLESEGG